MKNYLLIVAILVIPVLSAAQKKSSTPLPQERATVKKQYDEAGNLIRYDSTYTFRYFPDTTLQMPGFGGWQDFFGPEFDVPDHFKKFYGNDSAFSKLPLLKDFPFEYFGNENDLFRLPDRMFSDSMFLKRFSFQMDTAFYMGPDSSFYLPPGFFFPNLKSFGDLFQQFEERFGTLPPGNQFNIPKNSFSPRKFSNSEQEREWGKLIERQRKELDEFNRKWEKRNSKKVY